MEKRPKEKNDSEAIKPAGSATSAEITWGTRGWLEEKDPLD